MRKLKNIFYPVILFVPLVAVLLSSKTNAKYYTEIVEQVWKTNFTYFGEVNPGEVKFRYTIDAQSADNPPSMFDGKSYLNHNEYNADDSEKNRWTNWSDSKTNLGEDARLIIGFVKPVSVSTIRLYHFIDNQGCDIPRDISLSYTYESVTTVALNNMDLNNLNRNFDKPTEIVNYESALRDSIFRTKSSVTDTPLLPYYYMDYNNDGVKENISITSDYFYEKNYDAPYTEIYFKDDKSRVVINSFEISMQAGQYWYIGLTEMAIDWIFVDYDPNEHTLEDSSSYWYRVWNP